MASARFSTILVASLALLATTAWANPTGRIVGGKDATVAAHAVSLRLDNAHICGGTLVGVKHVLTAAHCVIDEKNNNKAYEISRLTVRVGSTNQYSGGRIHVIEKSTPHPEYNEYQNDIAILTLTIPVVPSDKIIPVEIATSSLDTAPQGANIMVAGWGTQSLTETESPFRLQEKTFSVASDDVCRDANEIINESNICLAHASREGNCRGDAGNGGIYNNKLVGVCSFVVGTCGSIYPDVFADVYYYSAWIQEIIES